MPTPRESLLFIPLLLCTLAGVLTALPVDGGALNRALAREMAERIAARQAVSAAEREALVRVLSDLDSRTLQILEARFGKYIPREALDVAQRNPTTFLDNSSYHEWLRKAYPNATPEQIQTIVGDTQPLTRGVTVDHNQIALARVVAHERLHQLSHTRFRLHFGKDFDEGTTDYLASRVSSDLHIPEAAVGYPDQRELAGMLAARVGEGPLAQAYFRGEFETLARCLDNELGAGGFAAFERHLQRGDYSAARALLLGRGP